MILDYVILAFLVASGLVFCAVWGNWSRRRIRERKLEEAADELVARLHTAPLGNVDRRN